MFVLVALVHLSPSAIIKAILTYGRLYIHDIFDLAPAKFPQSIPPSVRVALTNAILKSQIYLRMISSLEKEMVIVQVVTVVIGNASDRRCPTSQDSVLGFYFRDADCRGVRTRGSSKPQLQTRPFWCKAHQSKSCFVPANDVDWSSFCTSWVARTKVTSFRAYVGGKKILEVYWLAKKGTMGMNRVLLLI